ncbi:MAG: PAS domain S-box protein [Sphingomonadales bacterium]|nr:PAS domain S-box protein [Sphingomonadales bacterium]MDE2168225.1 PAS domain S-box protein [Sphingomonadales bacterium]
MAENSPSFMALLEGPEHRITTANSRFLQLVGDRAVLGLTVAQALPDAVEQGFLDLLDQVYTTGQPYSTRGHKYAVQPVPGGPLTDHFVDFVYQPLTDEQGQVTGIFIDGVDVTDRMRAQAALDAAAAQFHTAAQTMPLHIWTAPPDGQPDWFNLTVLTYSGLPERVLRSGGWTSLIHPEDRESAGQQWARSVADGDIFESEFRLRRGDGVWRWHLVRALPIRDGEGRIIRWVGTNTDIHEQKRSLVESAAERERIWTMSRDLMVVCTHEGVVTAISPSVESTLCWRQEDLLGQDLTLFLHPDDVAATRAEMARLKSGATTLAFENRYRTRDGRYRTLAWSAVPDATRIHGIARDITEERELARDRERIWNLSPVLKAVTGGDGRITDVNPRWTQVLGWTREETIGALGSDFIAGDERRDREERLRLLGEGKALPDYQVTMRTRDGGTRIIEWRSFPEDGTFYAFGRDVTAQVEAAAQLSQAEAALRQAQKMEAVGQLTGGIAHDFNNLLQGISGSLEIVQRRVSQGRYADLDRFIGGATTAASRAAALTHRLLAFSRRQPLDPRPLRANELITSMEDLLRRTIGEGIALTLDLASHLWVTRCDANQLESAILNLVINARDAMPEGGRVSIETCNVELSGLAAARQGVTPGGYVSICVCDTGVGMDEETLARAFEPFFTTKPIGQGTGLGLSMIYGFAQQSQGHARIQSRPGQGTSFRLYLPRFLGPVDKDDEVPPRRDLPASERGEVVLVVEDEPVVRGLIRGELTELGYEVIEAGDGAAGLAILQSPRPIDLLVTDIGMPELNGRQMVDAARVIRPRLPVLFMTGYAENAAQASGFLEQGMALITKPFAMESLIARIRVMMEETGPLCVGR